MKARYGDCLLSMNICPTKFLEIKPFFSFFPQLLWGYTSSHKDNNLQGKGGINGPSSPQPLQYFDVLPVLQFMQYIHGELSSLFQINSESGSGPFRFGLSCCKQGFQETSVWKAIKKQHYPFCQGYSLSQEAFWSFPLSKIETVKPLSV